MDNFAAIIHTSNELEFIKRTWAARFVPKFVLSRLLNYFPQYKLSEVEEMSSMYNQTTGWIISCPISAKHFTESYEKQVIKRIVQAGTTAQKLGAKIIGLGNWKSLTGDMETRIAKHFDVPVTSGKSYSLVAVVEAIKATLSDHVFHKKSVVVIGTSSAANVCAEILAREVRNLTLVDKKEVLLHKLSAQILYNTGLVVKTCVDIELSIANADIVINFSRNIDFNPYSFSSGAIVCDFSGNYNFMMRTALRRDLIFIEGGVVQLPGHVNPEIIPGFPPGMIPADIAEPMILSLEKRYESFTLGSEINIRKVKEIGKLAHKHGFRVSGFYGPGKVKLML